MGGLLYTNRVCNGNVTLPRKKFSAPCADFGGSPSATALWPDPVDLISNPLESFENRCTESMFRMLAGAGTAEGSGVATSVPAVHL